MHKAKGRGDDIKNALDALDSSIVGFQEEIECCAQQRFGRIEENTIQGYKAVKNLVATVTGKISNSSSEMHVVHGNFQCRTEGRLEGRT